MALNICNHLKFKGYEDDVAYIFVLANEWICKLKYFHCTETKSNFCNVQESPVNYLFINSDLFYMIFFIPFISIIYVCPKIVSTVVLCTDFC